MKITIERAHLAHAIADAGRAVSGRNTLPILGQLLLVAKDDVLSVTGTDLDTAITAKAPCSVAVEGSLALPASPLSDYIGKLGDAPVTIEFDEDKGKVVLKSGHSRHTMSSSPAADFPAVPTLEEKNATEITLPLARLGEMLRLTTFAASKEESRSVLMGVLFEARKGELSLVASDAHRLALVQQSLEVAVESSVCAIISAKPLAQMLAMMKSKEADASISIRFGDSQVQFGWGETVLISRVLDGQFLNYEKVIPTSRERRVTFNRAELLAALRRVDIVAKNASQKFIAEFGASSVVLRADSPDSGSSYEEVAVANDGDELVAAYNSKYLMEVLNLMGEEELSWDLRGSLQPSILRGAGDFTYIVMPMQVN